jgi:hypothetical protein
VQAKSSEPVVDIGGMAAKIQLKEGPATITADKARYNIDSQKVDVLGPILFTAGRRLPAGDPRRRRRHEQPARRQRRRRWRAGCGWAASPPAE